jgi:hypothetical protein
MRRVIAWVALAVLLVQPVVAGAQPILKFDDPTGPGGTVSYSGTPADGIVGKNIQFQSILGIDTPKNPGVEISCVGCLLNFQTGAVTQEGVPGGVGFLTQPGVAITITGAIPAVGLPAGSNILSGTFTSPSIEAIGEGLDFGLFLGSGVDTKNPALAAFFGLPPAFQFANTAIQSDLTFTPATGAFTGIVVNADLNNTSQIVVPYPFTLLLLGAGLLGAGLIRRRII